MDAASKLLNGPYRPHGREEVKGRIERENTKICLICGEEVGLRDDGELFVACYGCGLPVCQLCYEYERAQGNHSCPHCQARYKRNEGCPRVPGDEDDDVTDLGALDDEYQVKGHEDNQQRSRASGPSFLHEDEDHQRQQWHPTVPAFPTSAGSVAASDRAVNDDKATHGDTEWKARVEKWKARQERTRGSAVNPDGGDDGEGNEEERVLMAEARQPLWRKVPIPASRINPYRIVVVLRLVALGFFLHFRVTNPAEDAYPLWLVSVICEIWFALSWILDQFPKWFPINRETYLDRLSLRFDREGEPSRLAAVDVFVSTVDPLKEPPIVTANTVLSVLAVDYPVGKISCYVSDDGASMLLFDALSETAEFARRWVPFCKKHCVEPRAPEFYFSQKIDYLKDKVQPSFVRDRRAMKREYEEFKVRINALVAKAQKVPEEGWVMQDGSPWPGNNPRDHPGMIQVYLGNQGALDVEGAELPRLVYVSREKRPGYHHHKKAGAMNALVRVSAVLTNAPFVLNLDCDHYINNCQAIKEAMCFLMDPQLGKKLCFVQFPQRFDGIDPNDRYANRNVVFFDINMRGLDGIQGPVYVGTGCVFNRQALYGYDPPAPSKRSKMTCDCWASWCGRWCCCCPGGTRRSKSSYTERSGGFLRGSKHRKMKRESRWRKGPPALVLDLEEIEEGIEGDEVSERSSLMSRKGFEKRFGQSPAFITSTLMEGGGIPPGGADSSAPIKEAIHVISCGYEERTEWGREIGWIYGSVTEDILTGFKMHCRGWKSAYCMPARAAFKGSAPINLSDRLHQVLRWALGSVEIFLSRHCPLWYGYGGRLKWLERLAYTNTIVYPFTSVPLLAYCTVPAVCLLTGKFIIPAVSLPPPFAADYIIQPPLSRLTRGTADGPGERLVCGPLPLHRRHRRAGAAVERGEHPGLVAERAVLGHRRRLRPPLRRLPGPPQGPRRRRHQLHRHLEGRRRLRFRRALPPQVDLPPRPSDHPPHPQHHRPRRRSLGGRQQRLLLLGPALREALLRLLGHRPPLPVPQGPPREAEPDADSGGALVHPPRLRPLSGVGPHRPLPPQAAGPNSQAMRSRVLTRPK